MLRIGGCHDKIIHVDSYVLIMVINASHPDAVVGPALRENVNVVMNPERSLVIGAIDRNHLMVDDPIHDQTVAIK